MAVNKQLHTRQLQDHVLKSTENFDAVRGANEPTAYTSHPHAVGTRKGIKMRYKSESQHTNWNTYRLINLAAIPAQPSAS
jgi:hypothetical protein